MNPQTEQQTIPNKKMKTLNKITKELIEKANKYKEDKKNCCLCNPKSKKEFLCSECLSKGWVLK